MAQRGDKTLKAIAASAPTGHPQRGCCQADGPNSL